MYTCTYIKAYNEGCESLHLGLSGSLELRCQDGNNKHTNQL